VNPSKVPAGVNGAGRRQARPRRPLSPPTRGWDRCAAGRRWCGSRSRGSRAGSSTSTCRRPHHRDELAGL